MHSVYSRANNVGTLFATVAAGLCVLVALSDTLHSADPSVQLQVTEVKKLGQHKGRQDQAALSIALDADLRSVFSWNTKQLFVYLQAEYATRDNGVNQVVLWDKIVQDRADALLRVRAPLRLKYPFIDRGNDLRGLAYNLTLAWNIMPKVRRCAAWWRAWAVVWLRCRRAGRERGAAVRLMPLLRLPSVSHAHAQVGAMRFDSRTVPMAPLPDEYTD
jgi:signal peptidase complex subunit 3